MKILLIPQRNDWLRPVTSAVVQGDTLAINGDEIDLSGIPDDAVLPSDAVSSPYVFLDVSRKDGELIVPVLLPVGPGMLSKAPVMTITATGGSVELPEVA